MCFSLQLTLIYLLKHSFTFFFSFWLRHLHLHSIVNQFILTLLSKQLFMLFLTWFSALLLYCCFQECFTQFFLSFILPKFIFKSLQSQDLHSKFLKDCQFLFLLSFFTRSLRQTILPANFSWHFNRVFKNAHL